MAFNVVNFVEGYVLGSDDSANSDMSETTLIDRLPTWGEVIFDDGWSIKIKKSDEIANTDRFSFSKDYSDLPYLSRYWRDWTIYFCVYHSGQLLFGNTVKTYTSQQWSWSMWESDTAWLNVYDGHGLGKLLTISAEKTSGYNGLMGINIYLTFEIKRFFYRYNINGEIDEEQHSLSEDSSGNALQTNFAFYTKNDYQQQAEDIIDYGLTVTNSKKFEYKIYDV